MNLYVVTEGQTEAEVFKYWISFVNQNLKIVYYIDDIIDNNFYLISAKGYPQYFDIIKNAILDINDRINNQINFDRLVISVDSEEMTKEEKLNELNDFLAGFPCIAEIKIVIQHFCFETWALGNRKIISPNAHAQVIREYRQIFDVRKNDPELLPPLLSEKLSRAKFAEKYLRLALHNKYKQITYIKGRPSVLNHFKYFDQVKKRFEETDHIQSFSDFLNAFT
jgi:hypothetical protein